jgi:hypothetical protein
VVHKPPNKIQPLIIKILEEITNMSSDTQKKTLILARPNHFLSDADNMNEIALSGISPSELEDYRTAYEGTYTDEKASDLATSQEATNAIRTNIELLFGNNSKQVRYFDREIRNGDTLFDIHYRGITEPYDLEKKINRANKAVEVDKTVQGNGVDADTMTEVNDAIAYLIKNGYTYGTDFNATNATDISKTHYLEQVSLDQSLSRWKIDSRVDKNECSTDTLAGITIEDYNNGFCHDLGGNKVAISVGLEEGCVITNLTPYTE